MYVSLTQVTFCNNLQIISFNPNQLLQPIPECVNVCAAHSDVLDEEIGCCRNKVLSKSKVKQKPLFNFELQIANNYANIFEDVKDKINKLENYVQK